MNNSSLAPWVSTYQALWEIQRLLHASSSLEAVSFISTNGRWFPVHVSSLQIDMDGKSYNDEIMNSLLESKILKSENLGDYLFLTLTKKGEKLIKKSSVNEEKEALIKKNQPSIPWSSFPHLAWNVLEHLEMSLFDEDICFRFEDERWISVPSSSPFCGSNQSYAQSTMKPLVESGVFQLETYKSHSFLVLTGLGYATVKNPPSNEERGIPDEFSS